MKTSANGIAVVKHYEQFMANPYLCPAHVATIGYGTTVYDNGKKVRLSDHVITEPEAVELLMHDLEKFEKSVSSLLKVTVTQSQFDALASFSYNVGSGALENSTLLKIINQNVMASDADWKKSITKEFSKWIFAGHIKLGGLLARRQTEALLFCDGIVKYFKG